MRLRRLSGPTHRRDRGVARPGSTAARRAVIAGVIRLVGRHRTARFRPLDTTRGPIAKPLMRPRCHRRETCASVARCASRRVRSTRSWAVRNACTTSWPICVPVANCACRRARSIASALVAGRVRMDRRSCTPIRLAFVIRRRETATGSDSTSEGPARPSPGRVAALFRVASRKQAILDAAIERARLRRDGREIAASSATPSEHR